MAALRSSRGQNLSEPRSRLHNSSKLEIQFHSLGLLTNSAVILKYTIGKYISSVILIKRGIAVARVFSGLLQIDEEYLNIKNRWMRKESLHFSICTASDDVMCKYFWQSPFQLHNPDWLLIDHPRGGKWRLWGRGANGTEEKSLSL